MKLRAVKKRNPKYKHSYTKHILILLFFAAQGP